LIYAFVFSGLDGKTIILDLPTLRLAGPFRHVELLGNVSIEGLQRNFQLAIPFAIAILFFGSLSLLVTESALARLASKAPFGKKIITAVGISLASINSIADSAREVFFARKLRREERWSSLVPLLERTIVKAGATALRLSRSAAQPRVSCDLAISNLRIGALGPISVVFPAGSIQVITGATGSGKSTLLQAIVGQTQEHFGRDITGEIQIGKISLLSFEQASALTSFVPQFPQDGLAQGKSASSSRFGHGLSHGEAYELAFEQELQRNPSVLLLDEPAAALDQERLSRLLGKCEELARLGVTVVIAEHRISAFTSLNASYWNLESGKLIPGLAVAEPMPVNRNKPVVGGETSLELDLPEIELGRKTVAPLQLNLCQGEIVAITGANGSGKTTLLREIANARSGVFVHGVRFDGPDPRLVALVPDKVGDFFVTGSLDEELARADKVAQVPKGFTKTTFLSLVQPEASDFTRHPLDLSIGTQLALATAMQLSHKPQLLLLDEPVQGLDSRARAQLAETLRCVQETGCAIVFATHDLQFARALADKTISLSGDKRIDLEVIAK
jgi:energy-coupling factor transport system ATP-binding protein